MFNYSHQLLNIIYYLHLKILTILCSIEYDMKQKMRMTIAQRKYPKALSYGLFATRILFQYKKKKINLLLEF